MVLGGQPPGRVGRRGIYFLKTDSKESQFFLRKIVYGYNKMRIRLLKMFIE